MVHTVTRTTDRDEIRRRLQADRVWSIYALADLDAELFPHCEWWICGDGGLALQFGGISILPIFVMGSAGEVRRLLEELPAERGYLNLRDEHFSAAEGLYQYEAPHRMRRMVVESLRPRVGAQTVALSLADADEVRALYATGDGGGVAFGPFQLTTAFFRGVRIHGELVAVAGVHVVSRAEGVAGVGNVFTRPDWRGHGLAQITTSAVVAALIDAGITTIGLNVEVGNDAAIAAYERLGFRVAFEYWEGTATRVDRAKRLG
ncbi:MAG TPA: GNAT family N-acetyltransferase [Bryobacteraceae bacterium]|jgi:ribosomal protein S18 acetylase RimI-like enzyme